MAGRRSSALRVNVVAVLVLGLLAFAPEGAGTPGKGETDGVTHRVSVGSGDTQGNARSARYSSPAISAHGRYVAFSSDASNLVAGDTNRSPDVFVRDRVTKVTQRVSLGPGGVQGNFESYDPAISYHGRYVAFGSDDSNLVPGDTNEWSDVFVRDRVEDVTRRVSIGPRGAQANNSNFGAAISAHGRYVAWYSSASNLVVEDVRGNTDVFVRDRVAHETRLVSVGLRGAQTRGESSGPAISAHGRFVAFGSSDSNLVAGDTNRTGDVFVRDLVAGRTLRVSVGAGGAEPNGPSGAAVISAHGRFVAFVSKASNLVPGDTNRTWDVFVRDRVADVTERVSIGPLGAQADHSPGSISISATGRYVTFESRASNLVRGDTNRSKDVFVRDRVANVTRRVSVGPGGQQGTVNRASGYPAISADGQHVSFSSDASNLVTGDTNHLKDVFVRRLACSNGPACSGSLAPRVREFGQEGQRP